MQNSLSSKKISLYFNENLRSIYIFHIVVMFIRKIFIQLALMQTTNYQTSLDNNLESIYKNPLMPFLSLYDESTIYLC